MGRGPDTKRCLNPQGPLENLTSKGMRFRRQSRAPATENEEDKGDTNAEELATLV